MEYQTNSLMVTGSPVLSPRAPRKLLRDTIEESRQREEDARKIHKKLSGDFKSFALSRASLDQSRGGGGGSPLRKGRTQLSNLIFGSRQGNVELQSQMSGPPTGSGTEAAKYNKLCKDVRKQLIEEIMKKHRMVGARTDHEKLKRRRKYEEKQREIRRKKRLRKVISSKVRRKKKIAQVSACPECGDFHYKKSDVCRVRELKVKMIVQQIIKHSENIKENMSTVWRNLELLEETYEQIFLKTHRIQANRVCLGDLTGVDFLGEKHPVNCPCEKKAEKDRLDRERLERRRREEEEEEELRRRRELEQQEEARRERQRRLDSQLESKKKQFYRKMNGSELSAKVKSGSAAEKSRLDILKEKTSKIIEHFPELRSGRSSLVIIDGELKSLTSEFIEQDGMLIQEQSIKSLDLSELDFENANKTKDDEDDQQEPDTDDEIVDGEKEEEQEEKTNLAQKINLIQHAQKLRSGRTEEKTFDKVLDIMEVF